MNGAKAVFDKAVASPHVRWEKEMFGLFFPPTVFLPLSVLRHGYKVVVFLSCSNRVTE